MDYVVNEFPGEEETWIELNSDSGSAESDYPQYFFLKRDTIEYYPTPASSDNVITLRVKRLPRELSQDDYTTGSIKTMVNGSTAVVGNTGVNWTTPSIAMDGRFFKINNDNYWYEIASITDATNLVLNREYGGTAITAGTANYTIGEGSLLPYKFSEIPTFYALYIYYLQKKNKDLATVYKKRWEESLQGLKSHSASNTVSGVIQEEIDVIDPNDYPLGLS